MPEKTPRIKMSETNVQKTKDEKKIVYYFSGMMLNQYKRS